MNSRRRLARDGLILAPIVALAAAMCDAPAFVARVMLDAQGRPVFDEFGKERWEPDPWETWKLNWESHILLAVAGGLMMFGCASVIWDWSMRIVGKDARGRSLGKGGP